MIPLRTILAALLVALKLVYTKLKKSKMAFLFHLLNQALKSLEQAGAELGQAQLMLGLDFSLIFSRFGLLELDGFSFVGLIE